MSDIFIKQQALIEVYPHSNTWRDKVFAMSDSQVVAIYLRLKREGKIR